MPCDKQSTTVPPSLYKRGVRSVCHHLAGNWTPTGCSTCNSPESKKRTYLVCSIVNPTPIVTRVETVVSGSGISVGKPCGLANVGTFLPGSYPSLPVTRYSKNRLITFLGRLFPLVVQVLWSPRSDVRFPPIHTSLQMSAYYVAPRRSRTPWWLWTVPEVFPRCCREAPPAWKQFVQAFTRWQHAIRAFIRPRTDSTVSRNASGSPHNATTGHVYAPPMPFVMTTCVCVCAQWRTKGRDNPPPYESF